MAKYRFEQIAINCKEKKKPVEADRFTYLGLEHLDSGSLKVTRFGSDVAPIGEKLVMHKGDVLFGKRRAYQKKVAIAPFDGIFSAHGMVLRPKEDVVDKDFFPLFISSDYFLDAAIKISVGSLSPTINWQDLKDLEFELPPLDEQRRLATVLWAINDTMEAYKRLISATNELVKSQFIEMFGDPVYNEKNWPMSTLGELAEIKIGPFGSLLHKGDYVVGGHPLVNPSHISGNNIITNPSLTISDSKYAELVAYHLKPGDIVLGRRGEMGRCAVVSTDNMLCGTGSMIIRSNGKMKPFFLQSIISSPAYRRVIEGKAVGVTMMNLNVPIVSSLTVPLLPLELQERYETLMQQSDKSKFELEQTLSQLSATYKRIILENIG